MISTSAIVQIAILYLVIYSILKRARGSRFGQALVGVGILSGILFAFSYIFHFDVLTRIVQFLLIYIAVSTVVIFQPEIRRILMTVGAFGFLDKPKHRPDGAVMPEYLVKTLVDLANTRMGALIAFERGISLRSYEETGVKVDALYSSELVRCIFTPPLPLHDGGVVVRNGRISSAHCIFSVSNNPDLIAHGMRHRAAVGLSEETDALVIVVSEESGDISIAHNGHLTRLSGEAREVVLQRWVANALRMETDKDNILKKLFAPVKKFATRLIKGSRT